MNIPQCNQQTLFGSLFPPPQRYYCCCFCEEPQHLWGVWGQKDYLRTILCQLRVLECVHWAFKHVFQVTSVLMVHSGSCPHDYLGCEWIWGHCGEVLIVWEWWKRFEISSAGLVSQLCLQYFSFLYPKPRN